MKNESKPLKRVTVLVSGGGSNLQSLIDAMEEGRIPIEIARVISNVPGVYALERAEKHGIPWSIIRHQDFDDLHGFSAAILEESIRVGTDILCLAGFLRILAPEVPMAFPNRMINIHPSLLPSFGGKGMYGHHVHRAVLASGAKFSGATVHVVTEVPDDGPIIHQQIVPVLPDDDEEALAARVLAVEHKIYPEALGWLAEDRLIIEGQRVKLRG